MLACARIWGFLALVISELWLPRVAHAEAVGDFYRGKTVRLVIGFEPGTAYDLYARLLARNIGKHLPGAPTVVPQNMAGAGSLNAYNYTFNVAPRDGTVFGTGHRFVPLMPLFDLPGARFEADKFTYIGSANKEVDICVARADSGIEKPADLQARELLVGTTGAGAELTTFYATIRRTLGAKLKVISGYKSQNDLFLAIERGEIQGRCGGSYSSVLSEHPDWITQRFIKVWMQIGLQKDRQLPQVPILSELIKDGTDRRAVELMVSPNSMGRPFFGPPDVPEARVFALRAAFDASMMDPELLAEAGKQNLEINPIGGQDMLRLVAEAYRTSKEIVERAKSLVNSQ
jgi:tripartite-type tricarboxylate transporter receptor subunit TctC